MIHKRLMCISKHMYMNLCCVQCCRCTVYASWQRLYPNLGFEFGLGQAKIIEEALNQQIALFSYSSCGCQWSCPSSYFIHVMKQHYVHAGRLGSLTLEKKSQILANGTMQQLSYGNSVCYFLETRNTSSYSNNRSWPLSNDNLFQTLLYDDV